MSFSFAWLREREILVTSLLELTGWTGISWFRLGTNSWTSDTTQSGVRASCRSGVALEDPGISCELLRSTGCGSNLREMIAFGMKGAALAALGEMPAGAFLTAEEAVAAPLGDRKEGVKLGESTLSVFLGWLRSEVRRCLTITQLFGCTSRSFHYQKPPSLQCG
jgi:hypothetical protein